MTALAAERHEPPSAEVARASYTASADTTIGFLDRRVAIPTGPLGVPSWKLDALPVPMQEARFLKGGRQRSQEAS